MEINFRKILWTILMAANIVSPALSSELTDVDKHEIIRNLQNLRNIENHNCIGLYKEAFHEKFDPQGHSTYQFHLESGVEFNINSENFTLFLKTDRYVATQDLAQSIAINRLTLEFQDINFNLLPPFKAQIRKKFGKNCTEKFTSSLTLVQLALELNKDCYISDGAFKLINIKTYNPVNAPIIKMLRRIDDYEKLIRYLDPDNSGSDYAFFLVNHNIIDSGYESETLLATFQVEQVMRKF